jgi:hypothetical protein
LLSCISEEIIDATKTTPAPSLLRDIVRPALPTVQSGGYGQVQPLPQPESEEISQPQLDLPVQQTGYGSSNDQSGRIVQQQQARGNFVQEQQQVPVARVNTLQTQQVQFGQTRVSPSQQAQARNFGHQQTQQLPVGRSFQEFEQAPIARVVVPQQQQQVGRIQVPKLETPIDLQVQQPVQLNQQQQQQRGRMVQVPAQQFRQQF